MLKILRHFSSDDDFSADSDLSAADDFSANFDGDVFDYILNDDDGDLVEVIEIDAEQPSNLNIGDVIEAISAADPEAAVALEGMAAPAPAGEPRVRIVEQPASKALRFRYECEGRSAGSIPGVNSTSEHKTYPTIEVVGYSGKAIIVVSCVTRDEPYRPHPHNLVGRERCRHGVCTLRHDLSESARVSFTNLGIQCVKRRDIADALAVRESQRVDPFRTGFAHKSQPQSIDLNAVRLCFQVFLLNNEGRVTVTLRPVVSEVIYDKKAMSDLQILRISRPSGPVTGGTEVILLCEKVTREDISVVVCEEGPNGILWEESGNIIIVHKQVAIAFTTPAYKETNTPKHVNVSIQLKRISDGARSNSVQFQYIPEYQGTARKPLPDLALLATALAQHTDTNNNHNDDTPQVNNKHEHDNNVVSSTSESMNVSEDSGSATLEVVDENHAEKSLDDLLDQVAELDEIYTENRTRLENVTNEPDNEDFDDAGTYTSLQLAFKNPIVISEPEPYEDVQVQTYRGPIIEFTTLKRDTDERAPPLPPKRVRKTTESFKTSQTSVDSILKPGRQIPVTRNIEVLNRDRTELSVARSEPALPPVKKRSFFSRLFRRKEKSPAPSIRSEGKKESKGKPIGRSVSSVSGVRPSKFKSSVSHTSLKDNTSAANLSYADSITHISLHGDENEKSTSQTSLRRPASLAPLPPTDGDTILVAESVLALDASAFKKLQDDLDLTEAEHYALYMAVAPHATVSEFDETSCYYSPIDGNSEYLRRKRQKPNSLGLLDRIEQVQKAAGFLPQGDVAIKTEPSGGSPLHGYTPLDQPEMYQQQWAGEVVGGTSGGQFYQQHPWPPQPSFGHTIAQPMQMPLQSRSPLQQGLHSMTPLQQAPLHTMAPVQQQLSPMHQQTMSPQAMHQQAMSPQGMHQQAMSPQGMHQQAMSPQGMHQQAMSPQGMHQQAMSPAQQAMSPMHQQAMSPMHQQAMSPMHQQAMSPMHQQNTQQRASPLLQQCNQQMAVHPQSLQALSEQRGASPNLAMDTERAAMPTMITQAQAQEMESSSSLSLNNLLNMDAGAPIQLNSGDLSNLSALLGQYHRSNELSDSLNRLSTTDLLDPTVGQ